MSKGVSYQNKDILLKVFSESYKNKSFSAYGLDLPQIIDVLPTNLPQISANEKELDNLFLLEDGTYAIIDYESVYKRQNYIKYLNYVARVMDKYFADDAVTSGSHKNIKLRLIIIYTGDVEQAESLFDIGCVTLKTEQAFLVNIDGIAEYQIFKNKIENGTPLSDDDIMKIVLLPLTQKGKESKQDMLEKAVEVSKKIPDERLQKMAISGLLVACDKFVDDEYSERVRRFLNMTKVGRIIERERIEFANEYANEMVQEKMLRAAKTLLAKGIDVLDIMEATGLSEQDILSLQDDMAVV